MSLLPYKVTGSAENGVDVGVGMMVPITKAKFKCVPSHQAIPTSRSHLLSSHVHSMCGYTRVSSHSLCSCSCYPCPILLLDRKQLMCLLLLGAR